MKFRLSLALALAVAAPAFAYAAEPTAAGFWEAKDDDGNVSAWFLFSEKDDVFSARLVKGFKKPGDDKPVQTLCTKCTGDKKGAHIMGLTLFWGMKRDGLKYRDGSVLDPRDGSIYHALMNLSEDGNDLEVRGYLGISMFGKSQIWHRLPDDAMKKEDIPKEILAGGPVESADKEKPVADKHKPHEAAADKDKPAADKDKPAVEKDKAAADKRKPHEAAADKKHKKDKTKPAKADPADAEAANPPDKGQ